MFVSDVYIRFFRSFNFDYLRKAHKDFQPHPWDVLGSDGPDFPFVRVPLHEGVTTVVGANESGKSQLLGAIKRALTGADISRGDFAATRSSLSSTAGGAYPTSVLASKT